MVLPEKFNRPAQEVEGRQQTRSIVGVILGSTVIVELRLESFAIVCERFAYQAAWVVTRFHEMPKSGIDFSHIFNSPSLC